LPTGRYNSRPTLSTQYASPCGADDRAQWADGRSAKATSCSRGAEPSRGEMRCPSNLPWAIPATRPSSTPSPVCPGGRRCLSSHPPAPRPVLAVAGGALSGPPHWPAHARWRRHFQPMRSTPEASGAHPPLRRTIWRPASRQCVGPGVAAPRAHLDRRGQTVDHDRFGFDRKRMGYAVGDLGLAADRNALGAE